MVLIALSRSRPRSVQAFDLKKASACSRLTHSVIATRLGGGGPSKPTTFPPPVQRLLQSLTIRLCTEFHNTLHRTPASGGARTMLRWRETASLLGGYSTRPCRPRTRRQPAPTSPHFLSF